jgi:hypothetical protein
MRKISFLFLSILVFSALNYLDAQGISVDAGLTPAQNRLIFRTQFRTMEMSNEMMKTKTQMVPLVFVYGLKPGITLMARNMYVRRSFGNDSEIKKGINDPYLLTKFRLYRKNTANYVIGVAPHIASNIPIGSPNISNRTWNPEFGLNVSFRPRFYSIDISTSYTMNDILGQMTTDNGDNYNGNVAFSTVIPLNSRGNNVIVPVLEINYMRSGITRKISSVDDLFMISPGVSFISSSLVLEGLYQIPVFQSFSAGGMKQKSRLIVGIKYML